MTTVLAKPPARTHPSPRPPLTVCALVFGWLAVALLVDSHDSLSTQRLVGLVTWVLLGVLLARETSLVRWQTAVVVAFATVVEYTASPLFHVYLYRFHNVPAYVPPGHGLVYLAALSIGRLALVRRNLRAAVVLVVIVGGAWAGYGLFVAERRDVLGAIWFCCLLGFLRWGPSRGLYVGAFVIVGYLELLGTSLGTWAWQPHDLGGLLSVGNPPSGAAGGYGWFDLAAVLAAPWCMRTWARVSRPGRRVRDRPTDH